MFKPHSRRALFLRLFLLPAFALILTLPSPSSAQPDKTEAVMPAAAALVAPVQVTLETPQPVKVAPAPASAPAAAVAAAPRPVAGQLRLDISAINLHIPLGQTGLDSAGHLAVPADPNTAAWYSRGPKIGAAGTALVTGHLDSAAGPGVFFNLSRLQAGEEIRVTRTDGSGAVFQIVKMASYAQDNTFPWEEVYRTTGPAALRIITCDGVYSQTLGHYTKNLVVYANLIRLE